MAAPNQLATKDKWKPRTTGAKETIEQIKRENQLFMFRPNPIPDAALWAGYDYAFPRSVQWNPIQWAEDHGIEMWSKQFEICEAMMETDQVAVQSCHNASKSFTAAQIIILSWVDTFGHDSLVLFTGPDYDRVHNVTGQELRDGVEARGLKDRIEVNESDQIKYMGALRGFGRKPPDHKDNGFSGIHAFRPLVVIEEGCHVPKWMFDSASTITSNVHGKTLVLGNPDNPNSFFRTICNSPDWKLVKIAAKDTPNFSGEKVSERLSSFLISKKWVEQRKKEWGENSPLYISKVMAEFPTEAEDQVIGWDTIDIAFTETTKKHPALCLVLDVASSGKDEAVAYSVRRNGDVVKEFSYDISDLMALADETHDWWLKNDHAFVIVDANGIGEGVWSRLKQKGCRVRAWISQKPARNKDLYENRRAEAAFDTERALRGDLLRLPKSDDQLRGELPTLVKEPGTKGKWKLMSKEDMAKRGIASPNRADCILMACWELGLGKTTSGGTGFVSNSVGIVAGAGGYSG